jgi:hypothetical protein
MFEGDDLWFRPLRWEGGKWHIEGRYPTQAKKRLEWGTRHLFSVWREPHPLIFNIKYLDASISM